MTSTETVSISVSAISAFVSFISMFTSLDREKVDDIPIGLWLFHILVCFGAILYTQTEGQTIVVFFLFLNFFSILLDASYSQPRAQLILLLISFAWLIINRLRLPLIMAYPNGLGWAISLITFLPLMLPLITGIIFFRELSKRKFKKFSMAGLITMDYAACSIVWFLIKHSF